jgi:hypothetical protein
MGDGVSSPVRVTRELRRSNVELALCRDPTPILRRRREASPRFPVEGSRAPPGAKEGAAMQGLLEGERRDANPRPRDHDPRPNGTSPAPCFSPRTQRSTPRRRGRQRAAPAGWVTSASKRRTRSLMSSRIRRTPSRSVWTEAEASAARCTAASTQFAFASRRKQKYEGQTRPPFRDGAWPTRAPIARGELAAGPLARPHGGGAWPIRA